MYTKNVDSLKGINISLMLDLSCCHNISEFNTMDKIVGKSETPEILKIEVSS